MLRQMPVETQQAVRKASIKTATQLRRRGRKLLREKAGLKGYRVATRLRGRAPKRYIWIGGNPVPLNDIKQAIRKHRSGRGYSVRTPGSAERTYYPRSWVDKRGRFWWRERDSRVIHPIDARIDEAVYQVGDQLLTEGLPILEREFYKAAEDTIVRARPDRDPTAFKGKTQDTLSGIKYFRTALR